jgi:hypothetical protein
LFQDWRRTVLRNYEEISGKVHWRRENDEVGTLNAE